MYEVHANLVIRAPIEAVFDAVMDHERFFDGPDQEFCRLVREGTPEPNGLGAVREIGASGLVFSEEIVGFERPVRCEYVVRSLVTRSGRRVPMRHEGGWVDLAERDGATEVDWHSRFAITVPGVGWLLERIAGQVSRAAFQRLLEGARDRLEA